jgi:hypothetical protein
MYKSMFFLSSALVEFEWLVSGPGRFTPLERTPLHIKEDDELASEPVWTIWRTEYSCSYRDSISEPSNVQPVARRYTDY